MEKRIGGDRTETVDDAAGVARFDLVGRFPERCGIRAVIERR
jgi:hypothetical protein